MHLFFVLFYEKKVDLSFIILLPGSLVIYTCVHEPRCVTYRESVLSRAMVLHKELILVLSYSLVTLSFLRYRFTQTEIVILFSKDKK